jgi:hypothetical protein
MVVVKFAEMDRLLAHVFSEPLYVPPCSEVLVQEVKERAAVLFDYRRRQLLEMGLFEIKITDALRQMCESEHNFCLSEKATRPEAIYNHHTKMFVAWEQTNSTYRLRKRKLIAWPPLEHTIVWEIKHLFLGDILPPHPELMLRVLETKEHLLFNTYTVLLDEKNKKIVLLGTVWELSPKIKFGNFDIGFSGKVFYEDIGQSTYFYLGKWSL